MAKSTRKFGISGNALKILACISMLIDHAGMFLFPQIVALRILGRFAFPIFSFMIYEGCRYTKNRLRYFLGIFVLGAVTSVACSIANGYLYLTALITFSCSIVLIYLLQWFVSSKKAWCRVTIAASLAVSLALMYLLTQNIKVEFGLSGILLPIFPTLAQLLFADKRTPMIFNSAFFAFAAALIIHALIRRDYQLHAPLSLILLAFYNGERGMKIPKYAFYIFYPAHMIIIILISLLPVFGG